MLGIEMLNEGGGYQVPPCPLRCADDDCGDCGGMVGVLMVIVVIVVVWVGAQPFFQTPIHMCTHSYTLLRTHTRKIPPDTRFPQYPQHPHHIHTTHTGCRHVYDMESPGVSATPL